MLSAVGSDAGLQIVAGLSHAHTLAQRSASSESAQKPTEPEANPRSDGARAETGATGSPSLIAANAQLATDDFVRLREDEANRDQREARDEEPDRARER